MHEFVLSGAPMKRQLGLKTLDLAKRLLDHGFHPPTVYFPLLVDEAMLVEPTETETRETLDAFAEAVGAIVREAEQDPEIARGAPYTTPVRRLEAITVERAADVVTITVTANAFLHHMVRNIVGVLIAIGRGERAVAWCAEVLAARDRRCAGVNAPPSGLYFAGIRYAPELRLPSELAVFHPLSMIAHLPGNVG